MQYTTILASLLAVASASPLARRQFAGPNTPLTTDPNINNLDFLISLQQAPTAVERLKLLTPADQVYDFGKAQTNTTNTVGAGGFTVKADRRSFPALTGTNVAMTLGFLGPCGFNTPHIHPRSSEINVVVEGALVAEFTLENGLSTVVNNLTQYQMTVFPQGAMHTEFNPLCTNSTFVAGFHNEDPGVQQIAQTYFNFRGDILAGSLGTDTINGVDVDQYRGLIPANVVAGVESCLAACNIQKRKL